MDYPLDANSVLLQPETSPDTDNCPVGANSASLRTAGNKCMGARVNGVAFTVMVIKGKATF